MGDVVGDILLFFVKPPEISRYITLPSAIPDKTRLHSWNFCNVELCQLYPLKIPEPRPLEIPIFFLITPGNSTSFLTNHWKFRLLFLRYPQKLHVLNPLLMFVFLLEQPNVRESTQNKLKIFYTTSYKSHISKVENENSDQACKPAL